MGVSSSFFFFLSFFTGSSSDAVGVCLLPGVIVGELPAISRSGPCRSGGRGGPGGTCLAGGGVIAEGRVARGELNGAVAEGVGVVIGTGVDARVGEESGAELFPLRTSSAPFC